MKYILRLPRPFKGYEPGDEVPRDFAQRHPWAVEAINEKKAKQDEEEVTE